MTQTIDLKQAAELPVDVLIDQFPGLVMGAVTTFQPVPWDKAMKAVEKLCQIPYIQFGDNPIEAERNRKLEAANIIRKLIAKQISQTFPRVDPRLFQLERWLTVEWSHQISPPVIVGEGRSRPEEVSLAGSLRNTRKESKECCKIPLVLRRSEQWHRRTLPMLKHPNASVRSHAGYFNLECSFPGKLDVRLTQQANEASAIFYEGLAKLCRSEYALLVNELKNSPPTLDALWIPVLNDLNFTAQPPVTRDPALVVSFAQELFLVGTWEVEQEVSIETLIREFSDSVE